MFCHEAQDEKRDSRRRLERHGLGERGLPRPWGEFCEPGLKVARDQPCKHISEVGSGLDALKFAVFNERRQDRPRCSTFVAAREE